MERRRKITKTPREMALENDEKGLIKFFSDAKNMRDINKIKDSLNIAIEAKSEKEIIEFLLNKGNIYSGKSILTKSNIESAAMRNIPALNVIFQLTDEKDLVKLMDPDLIENLIKNNRYYSNISPLLDAGYPITKGAFNEALKKFKRLSNDVIRRRNEFYLSDERVENLNRKLKKYESVYRDINRNSIVPHYYQYLTNIYYGDSSKRIVNNSETYEEFLNLIVDDEELYKLITK